MTSVLSGKKKLIVSLVGLVFGALSTQSPAATPFLVFVSAVVLAYLAAETAVDRARVLSFASDVLLENLRVLFSNFKAPSSGEALPVANAPAAEMPQASSPVSPEWRERLREVNAKVDAKKAAS